MLFSLSLSCSFLCFLFLRLLQPKRKQAKAPELHRAILMPSGKKSAAKERVLQTHPNAAHVRAVHRVNALHPFAGHDVEYLHLVFLIRIGRKSQSLDKYITEQMAAT